MQKDVLTTLDQLIQDQTISDAERNLLLTAHAHLAKRQPAERVAAELKAGLSILALNRQLTPTIGPFFTELSREYLGFGRRGNVNLL